MLGELMKSKRKLISRRIIRHDWALYAQSRLKESQKRAKKCQNGPMPDFGTKTFSGYTRVAVIGLLYGNKNERGAVLYETKRSSKHRGPCKIVSQPTNQIISPTQQTQLHLLFTYTFRILSGRFVCTSRESLHIFSENTGSDNSLFRIL